MQNTTDLNQSELGKKSAYDAHYSPEKLFPISRIPKRDEIGVNHNQLPFYGYDLWNHYEVSWLNSKGKPRVAIAEIIYDCSSPFIIESKAMKLYFNSFNNTCVESLAQLKTIVINDLQQQLKSPVTFNIIPLDEFGERKLFSGFDGICIDSLDIECSVYTVDPTFLTTSCEKVEEKLYTDLLKSNCLVTNQPDWASVQISYKGNKINREGLLKYIISFRNRNEFHEQCMEKIYMDIMKYCRPDELTIQGRSTRRGGIDINSYRSSKKVEDYIANNRLCRQ